MHWAKKFKRRPYHVTFLKTSCRVTTGCYPEYLMHGTKVPGWPGFVKRRKSLNFTERQFVKLLLLSAVKLERLQKPTTFNHHLNFNTINTIK